MWRVRRGISLALKKCPVWAETPPYPGMAPTEKTETKLPVERATEKVLGLIERGRLDLACGGKGREDTLCLPAPICLTHSLGLPWGYLQWGCSPGRVLLPGWCPEPA